jgi:hypothetical protein
MAPITRDEALAQGYICYCRACNAKFKKPPKENYEDGHGGRQIIICSQCGCDLIADLKTDQPFQESTG